MYYFFNFFCYDYEKRNAMSEEFARTELLIGKDGLDKLSSSRVAVFGVGGVGGHVVEALVRSGLGTIDIIDNDVIAPSNINRQIIATSKNIGQYKVDVAKSRILEIVPNVTVNTFKTFYTPETSNQFDFTQYDYIVDAIDTVSGKIELVLQAQCNNIPIISSMGAGNKMNPTQFEVADIYKTSVCPLAKVMRQELKKRGVKHLKVVYSKEIPIKQTAQDLRTGKRIPGSNAFVPSVVGLIIASEVVKDLIGYKN